MDNVILFFISGKIICSTLQIIALSTFTVSKPLILILYLAAYEKYSYIQKNCSFFVLYGYFNKSAILVNFEILMIPL